MTIGVDLGDTSSQYCLIDDRGKISGEGTVAMTRKAFTKRFGNMPRCRMAIEVGTHSRWVSRLLASLGHEVIVAKCPAGEADQPTARARTTGWMRRCWRGWREWIRSCCGPSSTAASKPSST